MQFDPSLYHPFYIYSLLIITLFYVMKIYNKDEEWIDENSNNVLVLIYIGAFVYLVGLRPISGYYFGDTSNYAIGYNSFVNGTRIVNPESKEWAFEWLQYHCSKVMDVHGFFLLIEVLYVVPVLWACRKLAPNHYLLLFIVYMGAFSFFSYGTNSLIIAAIACVNQNLLYKIIGALLAFLAFNIHRSTALPIVCILGSFFVKDTRYIMGFWIASIFISLVAGGAVESFFTGLGFDDRMEGYSSQNIDASMFTGRFGTGTTYYF